MPFFFLRVDEAGNVTKRFSSTSFNLTEDGGACPVWNIHTAYRTPGVITPQFVELPDGERFFTISRTTDRPVFSRDTQDRRLALALGCELRHADRIGYAAQFNRDHRQMFSPIGISCHVLPAPVLLAARPPAALRRAADRQGAAQHAVRELSWRMAVARGG